MTLTVQRELDFNDLFNECWGGAIDTLNTIEAHDKGDELMSLLALDCFGSTPDMTDVNDVLAFEDEWIFEMLGISDDDEEEDEDWDDKDDWDDDPTIDEAHDGDRFDF